jgi:hypothetical protein
MTMMMMNARVRLTVFCRDAATAEMLLAVLSPDNRAFPKDQSFTSELDEGGTALVFQASSERPMSVFSTVESILADVRLFEDVVRQLAIEPSNSSDKEEKMIN